ncbi:MAG: glucosyl-3-phosphoglycerate synthase [Candidatus Nanopelagicales bacterium]|nr:glucosyl-3-phosphoglycerate synthase [Candidatus Nanopelagicales bacterium]
MTAPTISVCIPARDEAATIAAVISPLIALGDLIDEILVFDHGSTDDTAAIASRAGASVIASDRVLSSFGATLGKGDVLWRSVHASHGDIIVWLDADLESSTAEYVRGLIAPMLDDDTIAMVRATYDRTLDGRSSAGGRVTELTARPALKLLQPQLAHIRQPLGGEYAIRRRAAEALPFEVDYGVEIGLLIDVASAYGVNSIRQVELGPRVHRNRTLAELHVQAGQVLRAIMARSGHAEMVSNVRPAINSLGLAPGSTVA